MNNDRPPFILAFAGDNQGCGHHRVMFPLGTLVSAGLADGRIDMGVWTSDQIAACAPDVIVWQRPTEEVQLEALAAARKAVPDAFFVYEIDDRLDAVPDASYHAGYIPKQVTERVRRGLLMCDAATTTTEPLADWLYFLGATDVRVIPNFVPLNRVKPHKQHAADRRLRIGWGGGVSHAGDLRLIEPAIKEIGTKVDWVFLAAKPENLSGVPVEFHDGVAPPDYIEKLRSLDLDLILAPLEDNTFNQAKSNLRLVEAGAVGAAAIAQVAKPYFENDPPVFEYAVTAQDWTNKIYTFLNATLAERTKMADELQAWVQRFYTFESRLQDRYKAWLPAGAQAWRPQPAKLPIEQVVIAAPGGKTSVTLPHSLRYARIEADFAEAARQAVSLGADLLWLRPGTTLEQTAWDAMRNGFAQGLEIGAVLPLAADGPNAFPRRDMFTPVAPPMAEVINAIAGDRLVGRHLIINVLGGPAMLLGRNALAMVGVPDVAGSGGPEEAILEWGFRATMRGWKFLQAVGGYVGTLGAPPAATPAFSSRIQARGSAQAAISALAEPMPPADREAMELALFNRMWAGPQPGIMGFENSYETWSKLRRQLPLEPLPNNAPLVGVRKFGESVGDLDWVIFVDESVTLKAHAVHQFTLAASRAVEDVDLIYADHEVKVGDRLTPDFKPDLDAELLLGRDYITPAMAIRWAAFSGVSSHDRNALYAEVLNRIHMDTSSLKTVHIPEILATLERAGTPEEAALFAMGQLQAVQSVFPASIGQLDVEVHKGVLGTLQVKRRWQFYRGIEPLVSVIVPTRGGGWMLQPALGTLLRLTAYKNFEVIVVHNGDTDEPDLGDSALDPCVRWFKWPHPYNWSILNNVAVREHAQGEILCFMNDDVRVVTADWLDLMVAQTLREDVGAVGAKLVYPNNTIQHVGVVAHRGICGHLHKSLPIQQPGYWGIAALSHESNAVTAAVMTVRREVFDSVNGFDERLSHNYNDIAFCLELRRRNLRNIVECNAVLLHVEGATRPSPATPEGAEKLRKENAFLAEHYTDPDPYWNPNFTLALVAGGLMIQGLNCEMLAWEDKLPARDTPRVLLVNDKPGFEGRAYAELQAGRVPYLADLSGFALRLAVPTPVNSPGWDIRNRAQVQGALAALGITRVVLRSLVGSQGAAPPVEALRSLAALGVPVELDPLDEMQMCPWRDATGRANDAAQFGAVDMEAWKRAWAALAEAYPEAA